MEFDKNGYNEKYNVFRSRYLAEKWAKQIIKSCPFWHEDTYIIIKLGKYYRPIYYWNTLNEEE